MCSLHHWWTQMVVIIKWQLYFSVFTLHPSVPHPPQVTLSWWVCFWREGPTPWSGPCVETASRPPRWGTWTRTAWQRRMATGNTRHARTHRPTHQCQAARDVSITPVLIHLHPLPWSSCLSQNPAACERQISRCRRQTAADDKRCRLFSGTYGFGLTSFPCSWVR